MSGGGVCALRKLGVFVWSWNSCSPRAGARHLFLCIEDVHSVCRAWVCLPRCCQRAPLRIHLPGRDPPSSQQTLWPAVVLDKQGAGREGIQHQHLRPSHPRRTPCSLPERPELLSPARWSQCGPRPHGSTSDTGTSRPGDWEQLGLDLHKRTLTWAPTGQSPHVAHAPPPPGAVWLRPGPCRSHPVTRHTKGHMQLREPVPVLGLPNLADPTAHSLASVPLASAQRWHPVAPWPLQGTAPHPCRFLCAQPWALLKVGVGLSCALGPQSNPERQL